MSPAKNRSRRKRFKSRRQKGPEGDVTPNGAEGEKEGGKGGRKRGRKETSLCLLCPSSAKNFHLLLLHLITSAAWALSIIFCYFV